jgi:tetratricopeptide (TPR) repeat protein
VTSNEIKSGTLLLIPGFTPPRFMIPIEEVVNALDLQNYREAAKLLKALRQESPQNPWVGFYVGRYYEETGKLDAAEKAYRQVLQKVTHPKIISQARQGLKRIESRPQERVQQAIAQVKSDPSQLKPGLLVIEPIDVAQRSELVLKFARIMQLQPYNAKLLLPTRTWRMYRTGAIGELRVFVAELRQAGINCFCATLEEINQVRVFRISHFEAISPQAVILCKDESDRRGQLAFHWSEVSQQVDANLPIFKQVTVENHRRTEVTYKQELHEYVGMKDLHLPGRGCILRLCEESYDFDQGFSFIPGQENRGKSKKYGIDSMSMHLKWQTLIKVLKQQLSEVPSWSDFTPFAETTIAEVDMLDRIASHVEIFRVQPTVWDPAFQLYSSLVFLKPYL